MLRCCWFYASYLIPDACYCKDVRESSVSTFMAISQTNFLNLIRTFLLRPFLYNVHSSEFWYHSLTWLPYTFCPIKPPCDVLDSYLFFSHTFALFSLHFLSFIFITFSLVMVISQVCMLFGNEWRSYLWSYFLEMKIARKALVVSLKVDG